MSLKQRWVARKSRKNQKAWDRLHGRGAVSVPPRRRKSRDGAWDTASDILGDLFEALFKIFALAEKAGQ